MTIVYCTVFSTDRILSKLNMLVFYGPIIVVFFFSVFQIDVQVSGSFLFQKRTLVGEISVVGKKLRASRSRLKEVANHYTTRH